METAVSPPLSPVVPSFPVHRFTADQYLSMIQADIITPNDRVELIDGVITEMAPSGPDHNWSVQKLNRLFRPAEERYFVFVQGMVRISETQVFDPDVALVKLTAAVDTPPRHPRADEIDLVVEIANSSIRRDKEVKALAYAEAGIQDYWVVDLARNQILVHREPVEGVYQSVVTVERDAIISPLACPELTLRVDDLVKA